LIRQSPADEGESGNGTPAMINCSATAQDTTTVGSRDATVASHNPQREWKLQGEKPLVQTPWFQVGLADVELPDGRRRVPLGDVPGMIAGGEIRAASTSAAVLMIAGASRH